MLMARRNIQRYDLVYPGGKLLGTLSESWILFLLFLSFKLVYQFHPNLSVIIAQSCSFYFAPLFSIVLPLSFEAGLARYHVIQEFSETLISCLFLETKRQLFS